MGEESPKPASSPTGAVFLSYASQDCEAALRICEALRAAGIEVWFDQSEPVVAGSRQDPTKTVPTPPVATLLETCQLHPS